MKESWNFNPRGICTSVILHALAPEMGLESMDPLLEMEVLGLGLRELGAISGQSQDMGEVAPGEVPTGKRRLQGLAVVMLEGCIDIGVFEMYDTEGIVATGGWLVKRT
jgi:hypothetical protein